MTIVYQRRLRARLTGARTLRMGAARFGPYGDHALHSALEAAHHLRKERVFFIFKVATLCGSHGWGACSPQERRDLLPTRNPSRRDAHILWRLMKTRQLQRQEAAQKIHQSLGLGWQHISV